MSAYFKLTFIPFMLGWCLPVLYRHEEYGAFIILTAALVSYVATLSTSH